MRDLGNIHGLSGIEKHYYKVYGEGKKKASVGLEVYTPIVAGRKERIIGYSKAGKLEFDESGWHTRRK